MRRRRQYQSKDRTRAIHITATPTPIPAAAPLDIVPPGDVELDVAVAVAVAVPVPVAVAVPSVMAEVAVAVVRSSGRQMSWIKGACSENAVYVVEAVPVSTAGTTCSLVIALDTTSHVPAKNDPVGTSRVQVCMVEVDPPDVSDIIYVWQSYPGGQQPAAVSDPVTGNWKLNSRALLAVARQAVVYPAGQEMPGEYTPQPSRGCVGVGTLVVRGGQHAVSSARPE